MLRGERTASVSSVASSLTFSESNVQEEFSAHETISAISIPKKSHVSDLHFGHLTDRSFSGYVMLCPYENSTRLPSGSRKAQT